MLTELTSDDTADDDMTEEEYEEIIETIFGTSSNPTADSFYYVSDDDIETTITEEIFAELSMLIQNPIYNITITDYFPSEILEYFDITIDSPSSGEVSALDTDTGTITWTIDTLSGNETATLQYTLTIKDMSNEDLLGIVISTNEQVVLTYTDSSSVEYEVILSSSPQICLTEVTDETNSNSVDTTTAAGTLPQTGDERLIFFGIALIFIITIIVYTKFHKFNDIK